MIHPPNVLVVDDDSGSRDAVCNFLAAKGYRLTVARNAAQGLEAANRLVPDLIICDLTLPDQSGLRVLEQVRLTRSIPFMMLTALGGPALRSLALLIGADDVLKKPFSMNRLFEIVSRLCPLPAPVPREVAPQLDETASTHAGH
jgi:DNA-binding response OmpR family regulator